MKILWILNMQVLVLGFFFLLFYFVLNKLPLKVSREYVPSFDAKEKINFRIMQPMSTIVKSKLGSHD
jgi:hypothetical protein